jgi:hypothetical protein
MYNGESKGQEALRDLGLGNPILRYRRDMVLSLV